MASFFRNAFENWLNNLTSNNGNSNRPSWQRNSRNTNHRGQANDNFHSHVHHSQTQQPHQSIPRRTTRSTSNNLRNQHRQQPPSSTMNHTSADKGVCKLDINDVRDVSDINNLNARQLKTILTRNCIDYKGVFEKEVLREKVMQLWIDHNQRKATRRKGNEEKSSNSTNAQDPQNRSQEGDDSSDNIDESILCKICMEREIDCVLLECGHYLTCVTCGRKLAECPICRQNIVRCVRTFKA